MQFWRLMRGCAAACGVGLLVLWAALSMDAGVVQNPLATIAFGSLLALPCVLVTGMLWVALALLRTRVRWYAAPVGGVIVVGGYFAVFMTGLDMDAWVMPTVCALGAFMGLVAWAAAFGRRREIEMSFA